MKGRAASWRSWRRRLAPAGFGVIVVGFGLAMALGDSGLPRQLREQAFDVALSVRPREALSDRVVVIDIDRAALDRYGPWPWPRDRLAQLVRAAGTRGAAVVAIDALLGESAGAGADAALAAALAATPSVVGAVLDPDGARAEIDGLSIVATGSADLDGMMVAAGLSPPARALSEAARSVAALSLPAPDGVVRAAPLLAGGGGALIGGLASEAARVAQGEPTPLIEARTETRRQQLRLGEVVAPLDATALIRLRFSSAERRARRTIAAARLLDGEAIDLAGKIALIGASAPEAGGLRATPVEPFMPSVQIHADAVEQLIDGVHAIRPERARWIEAAAVALLGAGAIAAALTLSPGLAAGASLALAGAWAAATLWLLATRGLLIDGASPALAAIAAFLATALAAAAAQRRDRRAVEARFAQHLSPEVVRRIAADPDTLRLSGEERVLTALTTDIEGFTALTERVTPAELIALLDDYLDRVTRIVVAHGGTVDKIVGDAVLAFFNAPLDLDDHAGRAVRAALAIRDATEAMRAEALPTRIGLGRTRIGIETGRAVVGDVGGARKLDYTAYGQPINTAKKLEGSNKLFGSAIAVGPGAVAACTGLAFRRIGEIKPSPTLDPIVVSEPIG
ncbi:MAG: adenylate/guanylate cyclase domain-containing protein [Methylobacteriaceae bacterium]|nr:adenylate/guanylate cyclase domain-containing protein [Methylobacteriaceae bacterium]